MSITTCTNEIKMERSLAWIAISGGFGWDGDAGGMADEEPLDVFRGLQDEDDDGEPNAVVDGLIDDLRGALRIGRSA